MDPSSTAPRLAQVAVDVPLRRLFDYLLPESDPPPKVGSRVEVAFGRRRLIGMVMRLTNQSDLEPARLKPILRVLDDTPLLDRHLLELLEWAAGYYHHPLGEVVAAALPQLLRKGSATTPAGPKVWALATGGAAERGDLLKRAPRQAELAALLEREGPLDEDVLLARYPDWRPSMRQLKKKGLVESSVSLTAFIGAQTGTPPDLNDAQVAAVTEVERSFGTFKPFLLDGVTGSGKTEVYLRLVKAAVASGGQALILVPEISLTPQTLRRFRERLEVPVVAVHSDIADRQRNDAWLLARAGIARVVVGTRSAIWTPLPDLALIVVDEEHDSSFKQQEGFRYCARDLALVRARNAKVPVIVGSATPSLESLAKAASGQYRRLGLPDRAGSARMPRQRVVDMRAAAGRELLSAELKAAIDVRLRAGEQTLLFLNRRGYAPALLCTGCGWVARCAGCERPYTYHSERRRLVCHHCAAERSVPSRCEACGRQELLPLGSGTQRIDELLRTTFPSARTLRLDRDSTRHRGSLEAILDRVHSGEADILLGTQMLAKGHHFPSVTLVGILDADAGLLAADFRATERFGQLVQQVAGRCGRGDRPGEVLIQTRQPNHPDLVRLLTGGYGALSELLLEERRAVELPPHAALAIVRCEAGSLERAMGALSRAKQAVAALGDRVRLLGPVPSPMPKQSGRWRAQLLAQAGQRAPLHKLLDRLIAALEADRATAKLRWSVDVDPIDLY